MARGSGKLATVHLVRRTAHTEAVFAAMPQPMFAPAVIASKSVAVEGSVPKEKRVQRVRQAIAIGLGANANTTDAQHACQRVVVDAIADRRSDNVGQLTSMLLGRPWLRLTNSSTGPQAATALQVPASASPPSA